jgi:Transcription elongation factor Elf1 like
LRATATCYDATRRHGRERSRGAAAAALSRFVAIQTPTRVKSRAQLSHCHMTVRHMVTELTAWLSVTSLSSYRPLTAMGKRKKSSRKPGPKRKRDPLGSVNCSLSAQHVPMDDLPDTTFTCLFCHHDNSVTVKLDRKEGVAQLVCKICGQSFQSKVNRTSCPRM